MSEALITVTMASFGLVGLAIATFAALRGWQGWLEVKRLELAGHVRQASRSTAGDMIEMADLKERIRKLESIASCIDL
jgi:glycine/D-amino acid oxidase-like deaminating enzyme